MRQRMLLVVLLGHALVVFDLQFLAIWLLLLPALQIDGGKCCRLRRTGTMSVTLLASCCLAVSLWLSTGDLLFLTGNAQAALRVTPFYTRALEKQLTTLDDAEQLIAVADRLLAYSPYSALGHDAMANAAYALGDPTAKGEHRLSLNPLRHIDLLGLLMMFFVGFGWAKPVPVDMRYFKNPKSGMALTALAGPLSNFVLALVLLFVCRFMAYHVAATAFTVALYSFLYTTAI